MIEPDHGKNLKEYLLVAISRGGNMKYSRDPDTRMMLLKAVFDFNNCMAAMGKTNFIDQEEVARAASENSEH